MVRASKKVVNYSLANLSFRTRATAPSASVSAPTKLKKKTRKYLGEKSLREARHKVPSKESWEPHLGTLDFFSQILSSFFWNFVGDTRAGSGVSLQYLFILTPPNKKWTHQVKGRRVNHKMERSPIICPFSQVLGTNLPQRPSRY